MGRNPTKIVTLLGLMALLAAASCAIQPTRRVGESCDINGDCRELCATGGDFPGGFCTLRCDEELDCPSGTTCVEVQGGICLFTCGNDAYCRDLIDSGYRCNDEDAPNGDIVLVCMGD